MPLESTTVEGGDPASEDAVKRHGTYAASAGAGNGGGGVAPRIMGMGPVPSTKKILVRLKLSINDFDFIELNEAFASQALACLRQLGIADDAVHVNPNGGAIALGHSAGNERNTPGDDGSSSVARELGESSGALVTMCVGVGQGVSLAIEPSVDVRLLFA